GGWAAAGRARPPPPTFRNADRAVNFGLELEGRYGLGFAHPYLRASSVLGNFTLVDSDVTVFGDDVVVARTGRPLQGQAPYIINLGLNFVEPNRGTAVSLLYNRLGSRIVEVATAFEDDIFEEPRDVIDFTVTQPLMGNRFELRLAARDILAQPQRSTQEGILVRQNERFSSFALGLSLRY
ncbi:MAG: TonB-dependent receptor, partial [Rubricoccaceae bacterium]